MKKINLNIICPTPEWIHYQCIREVIIYFDFYLNKMGFEVAISKNNFNMDSINIVFFAFYLPFDFDIPKNISTYLHRIGRSGRWGRKGVAINFITKYDKFKLNEIEQYYHTVIDELPLNFSSFLSS